MRLLSRGLFAEECRRQERQIVADFRRHFFTAVGVATGVVLVAHFA